MPLIRSCVQVVEEQAALEPINGFVRVPEATHTGGGLGLTLDRTELARLVTAVRSFIYDYFKQLGRSIEK